MLRAYCLPKHEKREAQAHGVKQYDRRPTGHLCKLGSQPIRILLGTHANLFSFLFFKDYMSFLFTLPVDATAQRTTAQKKKELNRQKKE